MDPLYADAVTDIQIVGANARIRFQILEAGASPDAKPVPRHAFTVVMPVEAVAQLSDSLPRLVQELLSSGRLRKRASAAPPN